VIETDERREGGSHSQGEPGVGGQQSTEQQELDRRQDGAPPPRQMQYFVASVIV